MRVYSGAETFLLIVVIVVPLVVSAVAITARLSSGRAGVLALEDVARELRWCLGTLDTL